ncbi:MAG: hypothetical protein Q9190_002790 [Brigantiaea leucoxantha]
MPRKKFDVVNLPTDPQLLQDLIEALAERSTDTAIKHVRQLPVKRQILLRDPQAKWQLSKLREKRAALIQTRGDVAASACFQCQANKGLFTQCVVLDGFIQGGCVNCFLTRSHSDNSRSCSLRTDDRKVEAARRYIKDYNRRPANDRKSEASDNTQDADRETFEREPLNPTISEESAVPAQIPNTASNKIRLVGYLELPNPESYGLDELYVQQIFSILPYLQELDNRDLREFEKFTEREGQAWQSSRRHPERLSSLVSPSGSLDSIIAHHLQQPSFTTDALSGGETADPSNGCIAMVMGNAFRRGETLLFDHLHRRDSESEGLKTYPQDVIRAHEDFTWYLMAFSAAKVEIVYGRVVQERILKKMECTVLPLWARFSGVLLILIHESNFDNAERQYKYRKIMLFVAHPHRMFYEQRGSLTTIRQDLTFEVASLITSLEISVDTEYYQSKKWYSNMPNASKRALQKAQELTQYSSLQDVESCVEDQKTELKDTRMKSDTLDGEWCLFFTDKPYSNQVTRELIPAALEATSLAIEQGLKDWQDPSEFPLPVLEWFKGQKEVLFHYGPVSSTKDIEIAFKKCVAAQRFKAQGENY